MHDPLYYLFDTYHAEAFHAWPNTAGIWDMAQDVCSLLEQIENEADYGLHPIAQEWTWAWPRL